jgi:hypothetical protein
MHMIHRLTAVSPGVEDDAVASVRDALGYRDLPCVGDQLGQQAGVSRRQLAQVRIVLPRDDQDMHRGLRIDVSESDSSGIFRHDGRWNLGRGNTAEQAVRHAEDLNVWQAWRAADIYGCSTANPRCTTPLVQRPRQFLASVAQGLSHARALAE